jgi:hypothetical protein
MSADLDSDFAPNVTRSELLQQWVNLFGKPPAPRAGLGLMLKLITYELQARAEGGFAPALRRRLGDLAAGRVVPRNIVPGSQLIREWSGEQHVVEVEEGGYRWKGELYSSLSRIAQAITGAKWAGPRFFGLRK